VWRGGVEKLGGLNWIWNFAEDLDANDGQISFSEKSDSCDPMR
jgi:hypothetical protein